MQDVQFFVMKEAIIQGCYHIKYHRIFVTNFFIVFITLNGPSVIAGIDDFLKGIKNAV